MADRRELIATVIAVQLLVSLAVVDDRRGRARDSRATASPSPSPSPTPEPPPVPAAEEAARQRLAREVAAFAADQECADTTGFDYAVIEHNRDFSATMVSGGRPGGPRAIVVQVRRLSGGAGVSYSIEQAEPECGG